MIRMTISKDINLKHLTSIMMIQEKNLYWPHKPLNTGFFFYFMGINLAALQIAKELNFNKDDNSLYGQYYT